MSLAPCENCHARGARGRYCNPCRRRMPGYCNRCGMPNDGGRTRCNRCVETQRRQQYDLRRRGRSKHDRIHNYNLPRTGVEERIDLYRSQLERGEKIEYRDIGEEL